MNIDTQIFYVALIGMQNALFGEVPSGLRAITMEVKNQKVKVYFYYDGVISPENEEHLMIYIANEYSDILISTGYLKMFVESDAELIRLDEPAPIPKTGYLAYRRYEPGEFAENDYLFPVNFRNDLREIYGANIRPFVLIAGQKALLNRVEENLRKVRVAWEQKTIWLHFYYDDQITELNKELAQAARDEFMQSFPDYHLEFKILLTEQMESYNEQHAWIGLFSRGRP